MPNDLFAADPLVLSLAERYPRVIAHFGALPDGVRHLRRLVDLDQTWVRQQFAPTAPPTVVTHGEVATPSTTPTFDIIYAGGGLNLLNAAIMAQCYGYRVLVFDRFTVGAVHREWNISRAELQELVDCGLLTADELPTIVQRRYTEGLVRFHSEGIRARPTDLWLRDVLDVAVDADALTAICLRKIRAASNENVILNEITFERAVVGGDRVVVTAHDATGETQQFSARLLIDGMGATSPVACQLNCGAPYSLVCPTVGTVASGYHMSTGREAGTVDPGLGEVLVTTEHARAGRQLIWEVFPGKGDTVAVYLFHYAETGGKAEATPESLLLPLFEDFFTLLPGYKDTTAVSVIKPVYGFIPAGYKNPALRAEDRKVLAFDRVLSLGDAAALQSPLTFCGFGSNARNLRRITTLLHTALRHDRLHATDLRRVHAAEATPALARAFSKFMIAKPADRESPMQVNETLNVFCRILNDIGPSASREFFQDRIRWWDYTRLVVQTSIVYPRIFPLTFRTLSWSDAGAWIGAYGVFTAAAARNGVGRIVAPLSQTRPAGAVKRWLWQRVPGLAWRLAASAAGLRQALRVNDMDDTLITLPESAYSVAMLERE